MVVEIGVSVQYVWTAEGPMKPWGPRCSEFVAGGANQKCCSFCAIGALGLGLRIQGFWGIGG